MAKVLINFCIAASLSRVGSCTLRKPSVLASLLLLRGIERERTVSPERGSLCLNMAFLLSWIGTLSLKGLRSIDRGLSWGGNSR